MEAASADVVAWSPPSANQASATPNYKGLIRLSESLWRHRDRQDLFGALAHGLPSVIGATFLRLVLYDRDRDAFDSYAFDTNHRGAGRVNDFETTRLSSLL